MKDAYAKLIEMKYKLQHDEEPTIKAGRTSKLKFDAIWEEFYSYAKANKKSYLMDSTPLNNRNGGILVEKMSNVNKFS